jgi:hypothetical protein
MMENRFDRVDERLDKMAELQAEMNLSLHEHMRRTEIAEVNIEKLAETIKPLQEHIILTKGLFRITMILVGLAASIATILASIR